MERIREAVKLLNSLIDVEAAYYETDVFSRSFAQAGSLTVFADYHTRLFSEMVPLCSQNTLYHIATRNEMHFLLIRFSHGVMLTGPYLENFYDKKMKECVFMRNQFTLAMEMPVQIYYSSLPVLHTAKVEQSTRAVLQKRAEQLSPDTVLWVDRNTQPPEALNDIKSGEAAMKQLLVHRYKAENRWLDAVTRGNPEEALALFERFTSLTQNAQDLNRISDKLRNGKNLLLVVNTALRKAAEQGAVHPFYIDAMSSKFFKMVETVSDEEGRDALERQMTVEYAQMVKKHSLSNYSPPVRKAVDHINLNLSAALTLAVLSKEAGTSANHLSYLFNKETGKGISEYANEKRIAAAARMLRANDIEVSMVAAQVGIADPGYFTKLFKKQLGMSPRAYKKQYFQEFVEAKKREAFHE